MAKYYPRYTDRVSKKFIAVCLAIVISGSTAIGGFLWARRRNVKVNYTEGPSLEDIVNADNLGKDNAPNKEGTVGKEYGKDFAENNYNSVIGQKPENGNKALVENLLQGSLNFKYMANDSLIENIYTFDTTNKEYTLTHITPEYQTVTVGRYELGEGKIVLFGSANLNPEDAILGTTSPNLEQYEDIIYVADDGKIYGTIQGIGCEGISDIYSPQNQQTLNP